MKAYELPAKLTLDGNLELPETVRKLLSPDKHARVIVLVPEMADADDHPDWNQLTARQFLAGYAEADAVYDRA